MTPRTSRPRIRDGGSAAVSIAIVFPAVGVLFLALAQAVLLSVARDVAQAAAEEGLRVARAREGTHTQGRAAAASFAHQEPVLRAASVTVSGADTITVRVQGHAPSVLPGMHLHVDQAARGARERFTTPQEP